MLEEKNFLPGQKCGSMEICSAIDQMHMILVCKSQLVVVRRRGGRSCNCSVVSSVGFLSWGLLPTSPSSLPVSQSMALRNSRGIASRTFLSCAKMTDVTKHYSRGFRSRYPGAASCFTLSFLRPGEKKKTSLRFLDIPTSGNQNNQLIDNMADAVAGRGGLGGNTVIGTLVRDFMSGDTGLSFIYCLPLDVDSTPTSLLAAVARNLREDHARVSAAACTSMGAGGEEHGSSPPGVGVAGVGVPGRGSGGAVGAAAPSGGSRASSGHATSAPRDRRSPVPRSPDEGDGRPVRRSPFAGASGRAAGSGRTRGGATSTPLSAGAAQQPAQSASSSKGAGVVDAGNGTRAVLREHGGAPTVKTTNSSPASSIGVPGAHNNVVIQHLQQHLPLQSGQLDEAASEASISVSEAAAVIGVGNGILQEDDSLEPNNSSAEQLFEGTNIVIHKDGCSAAAQDDVRSSSSAIFPPTNCVANISGAVVAPVCDEWSSGGSFAGGGNAMISAGASASSSSSAGVKKKLPDGSSPSLKTSDSTAPPRAPPPNGSEFDLATLQQFASDLHHKLNTDCE